MLQLDFKQPPFMIAIFFISMGWMITWYVSSIEKSPTIQYDTAFKDSLYTVQIKNLTKDKTFRGLVFRIEGKYLADPKIYDMPPSWHSDTGPKGEDSNAIDYKIDAIHPGLEIKIAAKEKGTGTPLFKMKTSKIPVRLVRKSSFNAFVIRTYEYLIIGALGLWGLIILFHYKFFHEIASRFKNLRKKNIEN